MRRRIAVIRSTVASSLIEGDRVITIKVLYPFAGPDTCIPKGTVGTIICSNDKFFILLSGDDRIKFVPKWIRKLTPLEQLADAAE